MVVLDYGSGNIRSAERALEHAGAQVTVTADVDEALNADGLFVPGVGAFAACMAGLKAVRGDRIIGRRLAGGRPVLGICVGMQILSERGVEHGVETAGCHEWPGTVERLDAPIIPHMGWNTLDVAEGARLFAGLDADARFYFLHSYYFACDRAEDALAVASYGREFACAVHAANIYGVQFHPEKSHHWGTRLLQNFASV